MRLGLVHVDGAHKVTSLFAQLSLLDLVHFRNLSDNFGHDDPALVKVMRSEVG